jgi:hypothetical protein
MDSLNLNRLSLANEIRRRVFRSAHKQVFILDATKEQLRAAPAYKTLSGEAFKQRMPDWRAKAQQSWADIKNRAGKAYDDAKQRVEQPANPSQE